MMIAGLCIGAVALNVYAVALVLMRAFVFKTTVYRPMLWNIWLSVAPILLFITGSVVALLLAQVAAALMVLSLVVFGGAWLLLLPNASYLITELNFSHRKEGDVVPLWYDIILVITLAMSGVLNTIMNVFLAHIMYASIRYGDAASSLLKPDVLWCVAVVLLMLGFGMYLGRYLRLNSWDIRSPRRLLFKVWGHFREPQHLKAGAGFTLTYSLFLAIMYVAFAGTAVVGLSMLDEVRTSLG